MNFFIVESAVAATVGIYIQAKLATSADSREANPTVPTNSPAKEESPGSWNVAARQRSLEKERSATEAARTLSTFHEHSGDASVDRTFLLLSTVLFLLFGVTIWTLSRSLYVAPPSFYVLLGAAAGVLAWNIYRTGEEHPLGILVQLVLLAIIVKLYFFFLNPYVYASDAYFQFAGLLELSNTGQVPVILGHYYYFPGFAIFGYEGLAVTGLPLVWFGVFSLTAELVLIPAVYLIGREMAGRTAGLFAALLISFSVYAFLSTLYTPALFGLPFLALAIYAVMKIGSRRERRWIVTFWIAALGTFFSHPINALVLGLVLLVRLLYFRMSPRPAVSTRASAIPALSYGLTYGAYLAFIAVTSFQLFVLSIFAVTYAPALATAPSVPLRSTTLYDLESAVAPVGLALVVVFTAFGLFSTRGASKAEHRFFASLTVLFALIPAIEVVAQNFKLQSSRFLLYIAIPMVVIGGQGIEAMARSLSGRRKTVALVVGLFAALGFLSSATYLTNNDSRFLNTDVPAITTHITASALASRDFLALAKGDHSAYMDFGSWYYFDNSLRAPDALVNLHTNTLDRFGDRTGPAFVLLNNHFLPYGNPYLGLAYDGSAIRKTLDGVQASCIFDAGEVQVYLAP